MDKIMEKLKDKKVIAGIAVGIVVIIALVAVLVSGGSGNDAMGTEKQSGTKVSEKKTSAEKESTKETADTYAEETTDGDTETTVPESEETTIEEITTEAPTQAPTEAPTAPTQVPTEAPTEAPTAPTEAPTEEPTTVPADYYSIYGLDYYDPEVQNALMNPWMKYPTKAEYDNAITGIDFDALLDPKNVGGDTGTLEIDDTGFCVWSYDNHDATTRFPEEIPLNTFVWWNGRLGFFEKLHMEGIDNTDISVGGVDSITFWFSDGIPYYFFYFVLPD